MINDRVGAVLTCERLPLGHGIDTDHQARAAKPRARDRHQPDRSQRENCHGATDRNVGVLGGHKTGREHVTAVDGAFFAHIGRDMCQVRVSVVDVEVLSEYAILDVGKFPSAQGGARLRWMPRLRSVVAPIRGDRTDYHPVSGFEMPDLGAHFLNEANRLMSEGKIFPRANGAVHGMRIGGTNQSMGGPYDRIVGPWLGYGLVGELHVAESLHDECLHGDSPSW